MRLPRSDRRRFLRLLGTTALAGTTHPWRVTETAAQPPSDVEARAHDVLRAFDLQGHHRTGSDVDRASGEWLHREASRAGSNARLVPFALDRLDVLEAYVETGGRRIEGLPLFDGGTTDAAGVSAPFGPEGVHLAIADRAAIGTEGEFLAALRRGGRVPAIVVVTTTGSCPRTPAPSRRRTAARYCRSAASRAACSRRRHDPAPPRASSAARRARAPRP